MVNDIGLINSRFQKRKQLSLLYAVFAFALPVLVFILAYAGVSIFPFGDRQILTVDLYHQYAPFMQELRSKMIAGESLFFSWSGGLGINFYPLFAYYLSSPFNLLLLLFPASALAEAILLITILKVGLAGFTAYVFLRKGQSMRNMTALTFAMAYALSGFMVAYSWNIMWLDVIALLPLLAYTCQLVVEESRISGYIAVLTLTILSNYYVAFFACIFIALYFCVLLVEYLHKQAYTSTKVLVSKGALFAAGSLISGGISSFLLIPTYLALQHTSAAADAFPEIWNFKQASLDLLPRLLFGADPVVRSGLPNIYHGVFALLLIPLFFMSRKISRPVKFAYAGLLAVLVMSFTVNGLDFIWHGLHYPNQLPYRYAFVFVFVGMVLSAKSFEAYSWTKQNSEIKVFAGLVFILMLLHKQSADFMSLKNLAISLVLLLIYLSILIYSWRRPDRRLVAATLLFLFVCFELSIACFVGVNKLASSEYYGLRDGYSYGQIPTEIRAAAKELRSKQPDRLVRVELRPRKCVNDPFLYGLNGFSVFSSSFSNGPVKLMGQLGYPVNGVNSFEYTDSTIAMTNFLGLNYVINRDLDQTLRGAGVAKFDCDKIRIYENPEVFPLAFGVSAEAANFQLDDQLNPFAMQSRMFSQLFGTDQLFEYVNLETSVAGSHDSKSGEQKSGPDKKPAYQISALSSKGQSLSIEQELTDKSAYLSLEAKTHGRYYLHYRSGTLKPESLMIKTIGRDSDFQKISSRSSDLVDLGDLAEGDKVEIKLNFADQVKTGQLDLTAVRYLPEAFQPAAEMVASEDFRPVGISSNGAEFTLNVSKSGFILVTTTYEPGWRVEVDGQPVEAQAFADCFLTIPIEAGYHHVSLAFIPEGIVESAWISLAALLIFLVILGVELYQKRRWSRELEQAYLADEGLYVDYEAVEIGLSPYEQLLEAIEAAEATEECTTDSLED